MSQSVYRSIEEGPRGELSWSERWEGADRGLIVCWEVGRRLGREKPKLAASAKRGELPKLGWKGGVFELKEEEPDPPPKIKWKYGTLSYLAKWQGLRDEDLEINLSEEREITCSSTGVRVVFTGDLDKFRDAEKPLL
jgi:hypothetical protein